MFQCENLKNNFFMHIFISLKKCNFTSLSMLKRICALYFKQSWFIKVSFWNNKEDKSGMCLYDTLIKKYFEEIKMNSWGIQSMTFSECDIFSTKVDNIKNSVS